MNFIALRPFGCHAFKLHTKFERNRVIHGWVIDDLARFAVQYKGVGHFYRAVFRRTWTQLHQTWRDIGRLWLHEKFVSEFGYLVAFSNALGSKLSDVENDAKFRTFDPPPCENHRRGGRVGEISIPIVEALPTAEPPECIRWPSIHCAAAERGGLIKEKKKKKQSSWIKLKDFPTNVQRPNQRLVQTDADYAYTVCRCKAYSSLFNG